MMRKLAILWVAAAGLEAATVAADSTRGAQLFETLACIDCHSINGKGGAVAPDLGRLVDRNFTPATLAATMWNHAPAMWTSMHARDIRASDLDEQAATDLFAYFYATRFFEKTGDAGRGKRAFAERGCANCHGLSAAIQPSVKPVAQWEALTDPVALAEAMWNHGPRMLEEARARRSRLPELSAQDLADVLVYLRNLPSPPSKSAVFRIGAGNDGAAVFTSKGCSGCHRSGEALASHIKGQTLTEIAAAMWNHAPKMAAAGAKPVKLESGEMRELVSYLWAEQFFEDAGNPAAGRRVFAAKHCATCHENPSTGAPKLAGAGRSFNGAAMISALWHHGPRMLDQMKAKGISWPRFERAQMSDLIAFLNSAQRSRP
jgi:mono/diheme cytochrome c family protein